MDEKKAQMITFRDGVFVPVQMCSGKTKGFNYIGTNVIKYQEPIEGFEHLNPTDLHLISSIGLLERTLEMTKKGDFFSESKNEFENRVDLFLSLAYGIVNEAQKIADEKGVPYFAVSTVSGKPLNLDFNEDLHKYVSNSFLEKNFDNLGSIITKPKLITTVVKPNVDLYVLNNS